MSLIINPISSPIAFTLFNINIRWYGLVLSFSMLLCVFFIYKFINKNFERSSAERFIDFSPLIIISGIFGARFFYVLGNLNFYLNNPKEIFLINHGGLSIYGAIIFSILFFYVYSKIKKISFFFYTDMIAIFMPLSQAIGRFGNYFNQEAYGAPTDGFLKLFVDKEYRLTEYSNFNYYHPAFLYEAIFDVIIFVFLFVVANRNKYKKGELTCLYLALYSFIRFFMEFIRIDSILNVGSLSIAQLISAIIFLSSLALFFKIHKKIGA